MTQEHISANPLTWPPGKPRTTSPERSNFKATFGLAVSNVREQVRMLGGKDLIISTNVPLRRDGFPMSGRTEPHDAGVAVYFTYEGKPMCFACDRWWRVHENMRAIAKTIEALRGVSRWGTGDMMQAAFTGFTALAAPTCWWQELGLKDHNASVADIERAFRTLASKHHPDKPDGDNAAMARINAARAQGLLSLGLS